MIPQDIYEAADSAYTEAIGKHMNGAEDYLHPVVSAIVAERLRCLSLALDFASGTPRDYISVFTAYEMEELADHIRCGDTKRRVRPDNDNDDTVMK